MIKSSALHTGVGLVSRLLPYWPIPGSHGLPDFHSTSGAITVSIVYGIGVESPDDRFLSASLDEAHVRTSGYADTWEVPRRMSFQHVYVYASKQ